MSLPEAGPSTSPKNFFEHKLVRVVLVALAGMAILWYLPFTRLAIVSLLAPPEKITVPLLTAPDAITPDTVKNMKLLDHWGNGSFRSMAWSPDGRTVAILTSLGVNLYDANTFELLRTTTLPVSDPSRPSFSPDGSQLAMTSGERSIALFDLQENRIVQQWEMADPLSLLTFLQDGSLLAVTAPGEVMRLVDGGWQRVTSLKNGHLADVTFLPEQQALLEVYVDSTQLVDPHTGQRQELSFAAPYGGNVLMSKNNRVEVNRQLSLVSSYMNDTLVSQVQLDEKDLFPLLAFSPQGDRMATLNTDPSSPWAGTVTLWQLPTLELMRTFAVPDASLENGNEIAFSPDGEKLAVLDEPYLVKIFAVEDGNSSEISIDDPFAGIGDLGISPEGKIWTVNCNGNSVKVMERSSGSVIDAWQFEEPICGRLLGDGSSIATFTSYGEKTRIYKVGEDTAPVRAPCCMIFSANGSAGMSSSEPASSGDPVVINIWQRRPALYQKWKYYQEGYQAFHLAVSASGQYAAASSRERTHFYVRGVETGRTYPPLYGRLAFSPDERSLVSAYGILNLDTGQVTELEGSDQLTCAPDSYSIPVFSPDGQIVVFAACGQLFFWQTSDGSFLTKMEDPYSSNELQFSPDGTFLLGEGIGNASVWGKSEGSHEPATVQPFP